MSLFQCEQCGCVENTACCDYHWRKSEGKTALCSVCDPEIAKWHDRFVRTFLPIGMFKTAKNGNLAHIKTGDENYLKYAIPKP
jgi:hypothetical protein